jgi:hypothetical protein
MKAKIPNGICPEGVHWIVDYQPDSSDSVTWQPLYSHYSRDSIVFGEHDGGEKYALFGAPGLIPGKLHRFQVVHSCGTTFPESPSVTCKSECESGDPLPPCDARKSTATAFAAGAVDPALPSLPGNRVFTQQIEDTFSRPQTRAKRTQDAPSSLFIGGDGLGPDAVWHDDWGAAGALLNGAFIHEDGYALLPASSLIEHQEAAAHQHSFVEVQVATDEAATTYNLDLRGRRISDGSTIQFYFLKFARGLQAAGAEPDLILAGTGCPKNLPGGWTCRSSAGFAWVEMGRWDIGENGNNAGGSQCTALPVLGDSSSHKIWLRLRIEDDELDQPVVTGSVGWMADGSDCASTTDISGCDYYCTFEVTDSSDNRLQLRGKKGQWSIWSHERDYRLPLFRAGSEFP